ncbi:MAG TPA: type II secretion system F family protein [Gammaproteobacteria bacterium]|nr:type II secretion system F family protein [Gammaproteobacteria bacterium]
MAFDSIYLLYGAIFLASLLLIEGIYYLIADNRAGRDAANRRMQMLAAGASNREIFETLRRKPREDTSKFGIFGGYAAKLDKLIQRAGLTVSTSRIFLLMAAVSVVTLLVILTMTRGTLILNNPVLSLPLIALSIGIGIGAPILYLQYMRTRRMSLFAEQLPDALDVMVRSLHAGHPVSAAMALVTKEMPDPIGSEFGIAIDEMTYGLDMRDALGNLGERVDVEDFQYVVVSINIQHETGGNLAEVLHGLSTVIRARFTMFKKIRALSAEGRLSAKILAVMPFLFGGWVFTGKPEVYLNVIDDPLFLPLLGVAFVLELIGIYIMYKLVNFRV